MSNDLEAFRIPNSGVVSDSENPKPNMPAPTSSKEPTTRQTQLFIRGPIRLPWLKKAAALRGKSPLLLGLALHFQAGLCGSKSGLRLTTKLRAEIGIPDRSATRTIEQLETAGLVSVERNPGQCLKVSVLDSG